MSTLSVIDVAKIVHEANRALCEAQEDFSQKSWEEAEQWQRESAVASVEWRLSHLGTSPEEQHDMWCLSKQADGWTWGPEKDADKKTHPCLVPFHSLPPLQQAKDFLLGGIVIFLTPFMERGSIQ